MPQDYSRHNKKKAEQLGMPLGTAANRLKKMLMLRLLQRLGEDQCYKCGNRIETPEELSVEHKKPWLDVSPDLFWDLDNCTFSHRRCNKADRPGGCCQRKVGPPGTAWCTGCKEFHPSEDFAPLEKRWNGLRKECRKHHSKRSAERRKRRATERLSEGD